MGILLTVVAMNNLEFDDGNANWGDFVFNKKMCFEFLEIASPVEINTVANFITSLLLNKIPRRV